MLFRSDAVTEPPDTPTEPPTVKSPFCCAANVRHAESAAMSRDNFFIINVVYEVCFVMGTNVGKS